MEISHPQATWTLQYEEGRGTGPQKLQLDGKTLFSFMHCRIDDVSDDAVSSTRAHHFHKGGLAVFDGEGVFTQGPAVNLRQIHRVAANTVRLTYDLSWPKATPLVKGLELGSVLLAPSFRRFFVVISFFPHWWQKIAPCTTSDLHFVQIIAVTSPEPVFFLFALVWCIPCILIENDPREDQTFDLLHVADVCI